MHNIFRVGEFERSISRNPRYVFTLISYVTVVVIYVNLNTFMSPAIGTVAFLLYSAINSVFLGNAFFAKEDVFFRFLLGALLLVMIVGLVGWAVMIMYNLDIARSTLVLLTVVTLSSLLNKRMKSKNAT